MRNKFVYILVCVFFILSSCSSVKKEHDKAGKVFQYHLGVVENFVKVGYIDKGEVLLRSVDFLEKLTKIKCDIEHQHDIFYMPSKKNLKDWKKWFKGNKSKLYWDDVEKTVKIKDDNLPRYRVNISRGSLIKFYLLTEASLN